MAWVSPSKLIPDKQYTLNEVKINELFLKDHNVNNILLPSKRTNKFKGVVIHNTDIAKSADDGRQYTAATLNGNVASRTHYYVTYLSAWKNLDDDSMNWTCGDGTTGEGNNGCISLEIIMGSKKGKEDLKARDNGARIAAYILVKNNMTVNDMYTHNYFLNVRNGVKGDYNKLCTTATPTRNCPYYIVWDWENFRKQVDEYIVKIGGKSVYKKNPTFEPVETKPTQTIKNRYIFKAVSQAAIRTNMSKSASIIERVTKGKYYPAEKVNNEWISHLTVNGYSMLNDGGALFINEGLCEKRKTTDYVNIRSAPSTKSEKIDSLFAGRIVYVFSDGVVRNEGFTWYRVIYNGNVYYMVGEFLSDRLP